MNIIVRTASGNTVFRPDTGWNRKGEDIYLPDFVKELYWSPAVYARISRPGKFIGERFAQRYYDGVGAGILFYPRTGCETRAEEAYAQSLQYDHCTVLPSDVLDKMAAGSTIVMSSGNGDKLYDGAEWSLSLLDKAIAEVSRYSLVRAGDLVALELENPTLCGEAGISVKVGDRRTIELNIIQNTNE